MWRDVINCGSDTLYSVSDVKYSGCNVIYTKGVISWKERVGDRYSGCDGTNIVNMLLYTMDIWSPHIEDEIS